VPSIVDELLCFSCEALQLTPTLHAVAEKHYHAVADWLGDENSVFFEYDPDIYSQGSFRIGTTTRPVLQCEYDLDFVLQVDMPIDTDPVQLLDELYDRLREHDTYADMTERLKRCVRLNYANEFHMDILPAIPESPSGTRIFVPDRKLQSWKSSDPKAYARWFELRGRTMRLDKAAQVSPLPTIQTAAEKTVLQRVVQLAKRCRDLFPAFAAVADLAPRSIVLTTLAAQTYGGHDSTAVAVYEAIHAMRERIAGSAGKAFQVWNPVNDTELLSEQWVTNPNAYCEFSRWLDWFAREWDAVLVAGTIPEIQRRLIGLFGDAVATDAIKKHAAHMDDLRKLGALKVTRAGALTAGAAIATVRPNTFFGDDD
jgi:hypothetical protein